MSMVEVACSDVAWPEVIRSSVSFRGCRTDRASVLMPYKLQTLRELTQQQYFS